MINYFMYKSEKIPKNNPYTFATIVDINGKALVTPPDVPEHWERIDYLTQHQCDFVIDSTAFDYAPKKIERWWKVIHPELVQSYFKGLKTRGRWKGTNYFIFDSLNTVMCGLEEYHSGPVWFFGNMNLFNQVKPWLNKVFVTRLNVDFEELCPDLIDRDGEIDLIELGMLDITHYKEIKSERSPDWVKEMKALSRSNQSPEYFSEYMKLITTQADIRAKRKDIPEFYDYVMEEYSLAKPVKVKTNRLNH